MGEGAGEGKEKGKSSGMYAYFDILHGSFTLSVQRKFYRCTVFD